MAGIGVQGPGLAGWPATRAVLTGAAPYVSAPMVLAPPSILAANERRRATPATRLALALAGEAVAMAAIAPGVLRAVFASSNGDGATVTAILDALTGGDGQVSPTQFHNSVHNAPAGYWAIGAGSRQPATCLGCHDATAAGGLLKALAEVAATRCPVLLCMYDLPLPSPLAAVRDVREGFGVALVLTPEPTSASLARLRLEWSDAALDADPDPDPTGLAGANPMARLLPLLASIALGRAARHALAMLDGAVVLDTDPILTHACSTATAFAR